MSKKRIHELAKEYGLSGKDLAAKLRSLGYSNAKSHMTALDEFEVLQLLVDDDPTWHPAYVALASSDRQPEVRHTLLTGLRRAPRTVAEPAFRAALRHTDPQTRALAADMMGGHADAPVFVDALAEALTDADPTVRLEVVEALGKTRTAAALPLVQGIDPAGDDALQRTRARALERLTAIR